MQSRAKNATAMMTDTMMGFTLVILAIEAQYPSPNPVIVHIHTSETQFI